MTTKKKRITYNKNMTKENFIQQLKRQIRQNKIANTAVMVVGIFFLFLGLVGFILPVVPGFLFIIIGLIILGEEFFLTRWIIKKSPKSVQDRLARRKEGKEKNGNQ